MLYILPTYLLIGIGILKHQVDIIKFLPVRQSIDAFDLPCQLDENMGASAGGSARICMLMYGSSPWRDFDLGNQ